MSEERIGYAEWASRQQGTYCISITLSAEEYRRLEQQAEADVRTVVQQATYYVRREIRSAAFDPRLGARSNL